MRIIDKEEARIKWKLRPWETEGEQGIGALAWEACTQQIYGVMEKTFFPYVW